MHYVWLVFWWLQHAAELLLRGKSHLACWVATDVGDDAQVLRDGVGAHYLGTALALWAAHWLSFYCLVRD